MTRNFTTIPTHAKTQFSILTAVILLTMQIPARKFTEYCIRLRI